MYLPQNHAFFSYKAKKIIFPGLPRPLKWARNDDLRNIFGRKARLLYKEASGSAYSLLFI